MGRLLSRVLVALAVVGGVTAVGATPALAADCSQSVGNNMEGWARTDADRPLKVGPAGACAKTGAVIQAYGKVWLHCKTINSSGNTWWYVRIEDTQKYGWIYDPYLTTKDYDDNDDGKWEIKWC
jgi:hypothetical protein